MFGGPHWQLYDSDKTLRIKASMQVGFIREAQTQAAYTVQRQPEVHRTTSTRLAHYRHCQCLARPVPCLPLALAVLEVAQPLKVLATAAAGSSCWPGKAMAWPATGMMCIVPLVLHRLHGVSNKGLFNLSLQHWHGTKAATGSGNNLVGVSIAAVCD
jgi:hypothetical protein